MRSSKLTRSTHSPKLPFVSYSRIFGIFSALFRLQTLILPLMLLPARYWPSALIAMAQISPGLFWSVEWVSNPNDPDANQFKYAMKAQGVPTNNLSVLAPHAILALTPYLHFAFKASAGCPFRAVFSCGYYVMYAKRVRLLECLYDGEVWLCGVVDIDTARAGRGE